MQIHIRWDVSDLASVDGNLVRQHAWSWNFNRVCPVVVVVAQSVSEVKDCLLRDLGCVAGNVEVSRLHCSLSDAVGNQEEVERAVDYF